MDFKFKKKILKFKGKTTIPPLISPGVLSSASDKAKRFVERFSKSSNECVSELPSSSLNANLKSDNISIFSKIVKKIISTLDSSKTSGNDSIPVMVLEGQIILS